MPRIKSKQILGERPQRPEHLATKEYVDEILNGTISTVDKRRLAYFHSLSKLMISSNQNIYENKYRSSHNVTINEIWSSDVSFATLFEDAYAESLINTAVKYYNKVTLTPVYGSYGQTYCYIENGEFKDDTYPPIERGEITPGGVFIRPFIGPEDVYNSITNEISYGYELKLFRGLDATSGTPDTEIGFDEGEWFVNYYSGTIHFLEGFTPTDLGWGTIRATFFKYDGSFISDDYNTIFKSAVFENNSIIFNKNAPSEVELDLSTLILPDTIKNISLNTNKELVVTKSDNSTFNVNLNPVIKDLVSDVIFNDNVLIFYKSDGTYLEVDVNEILLDYGFSFVDADIIDNHLVFTTVMGTSYSIQISQLQDRSAFNQAELIDNILQFRKQDGDIDFVDLSEIQLNPDLFLDATFNETNDILTFDLYGGGQKHIDLSSLKETDGTTSIFNTLNINMIANETTSGSTLACNIPILSSNIVGSNVLVFINGVQVVLGDNDNCDCYFSNDDGITKKNLNNITLGDKLYWTYNNSIPHAGYELSSVDRITFNYLNIK